MKKICATVINAYTNKRCISKLLRVKNEKSHSRNGTAVNDCLPYENLCPRA